MKSTKFRSLALEPKDPVENPAPNRDAAAERAHRILTAYDKLHPGLEDDFLLTWLFYDILQLCERYPVLRSFKEQYVFALDFHLGDFSAGCVEDEIERLEKSKKAKRRLG